MGGGGRFRDRLSVATSSPQLHQVRRDECVMVGRRNGADRIGDVGAGRLVSSEVLR